MNIFLIIKGTPYWVWGILAYLLYVGIKAIRPSIGSVYQFSIMPSIFIGWSLYAIFKRCATCSAFFAIWFIILGVGIYLGYHFLRRRGITVNEKTNRLHVPGSWLPLILSLTFFVTKYVIKAAYAIYPETHNNMALQIFDLGMSGLISGISLGRFIHMLQIYQTRK